MVGAVVLVFAVVVALLCNLVALAGLTQERRPAAGKAAVLGSSLALAAALLVAAGRL